jgi:hypothetical protein
MSLDLTPATPEGMEIHEGDGVPIRWTTDVDADPEDIVFEVDDGRTFTGEALTKTYNGDGTFTFKAGSLLGAEFVLQSVLTKVEMRHEGDPSRLDVGIFRAEPRLTTP